MKQVAAPGRTRSGYRGLQAYGYQPHIETANDAVFSVASLVTVMVNGRVLERGAPTVIRESPAVQQAYLGTAELDS